MGPRLAICAAALGLGACGSTGISYDARLPAGHVEASTYRAVTVEGFRGPEGGWFTDRFEGMLANAYFDGWPWFVVSAPHAPADAVEGVYSGSIDVEDVDVDDYVETRRKCVEWDGLFDCERRADVAYHCVKVRVEASVTPRLTDATTGRLVFQERYRGSASDTDCDKLGIVGEGDHHYRHYGGYGGLFGWEDGYRTGALVREALADTLADIRRDIAPRNASVRAPLITEAIEPEAGADPRYGEAVAAAKDGQSGRACLLWTALRESYPEAPGVAHNAGACAEAAGDFDQATALYAEAEAAMVFYPRADRGVERIQKALRRLSERRAGEALMDELTAPPPLPPASDVEGGPAG